MTIVLEPAAQAVADATAKPFLYGLTPGEARKVREDLRAATAQAIAFLRAALGTG
jgi:hypothetical protein